jgi:hypothetical protein
MQAKGRTGKGINKSISRSGDACPSPDTLEYVKKSVERVRLRAQSDAEQRENVVEERWRPAICTFLDSGCGVLRN